MGGRPAQDVRNIEQTTAKAKQISPQLILNARYEVIYGACYMLTSMLILLRNMAKFEKGARER